MRLLTGVALDGNLDNPSSKFEISNLLSKLIILWAYYFLQNIIIFIKYFTQLSHMHDGEYPHAQLERNIVPFKS